MQDKYFKQKRKGQGPILLELFPFVVLNGFLNRVLCLCYYSPYTGRSTPTTAFDLFLYNVDTLKICMKEFGSEKVILDKMTVVRT